MAVETITAAAQSTIADLNADWPLGPEDLRAGDDHIRNTKRALRLTFPGISETVQSIAQELDFAHQGGTVSGNATIKGWLSVSGTVNTQWLVTTQGISARGNGIVATDINATGSISASGSLIAGTSLRVNETTSLSGTVVVKQHLRVVGVMTVSGSAVIKDDLAVKANLSVSGGIVAGSIFGLKMWTGRFNVSATISHYGATLAFSTTYFASTRRFGISHGFGSEGYQVLLSNADDIGANITGASASHRAILMYKGALSFSFSSERSSGSRLACDITILRKA